MIHVSQLPSLKCSHLDLLPAIVGDLVVAVLRAVQALRLSLIVVNGQKANYRPRKSNNQRAQEAGAWSRRLWSIPPHDDGGSRRPDIISPPPVDRSRVVKNCVAPLQRREHTLRSRNNAAFFVRCCEKLRGALYDVRQSDETGQAALRVVLVPDLICRLFLRK